PAGAPSKPSGTSAPATSSASAAAPTIFGFQLLDPSGVAGMVLLLIVSALGGAVMNLTPCVLPVIPIKVMTLTQHAGGSKKRALTLGIWMALGVVAFWVAIGIPMAFFSAIDPSQLIFGTWWVTFCLGLIIGAMGLGIMGMFTIQLPQRAYMI